MIGMRGFLSTTVLLTLLSSITATPYDRPSGEREPNPDLLTFHKLLDQADPPSLHAALHDFSPKKFAHGMFKEDRTAVEAIHREEPSLATSIINLAKRQVGAISNGTSPTSAPAAQSSPPTEASPSPGSEQTSTRVTPVPLAGPSEATASPSPSTPTTGAEVSASPSDLSSGAVVSSAGEATSSATGAESSPATTSFAEPSSSFTNGQVVTTTNAEGYIVVSTIGGGVYTITPSGKATSGGSGGGSKTSVYVHVSTLPNGAQSTITAVTVIGAGGSDEPTPTGEAGASSGTATGAKGLQTGEAVMTRGFGWEGVGVLIGAVGFAVMM